MESLVGQSLAGIEIIAVNDASSDGSVEILEWFRRSHPDRVTVLHTQERGGAGGARNVGVGAARGQYLAFVDGDDYLDVTMLEKLYNAADLSSADIVACDHYRFAQSEESLQLVRPWAAELFGDADHRRRDLRVVAGGKVVWGQLIKRSLFAEFDVRFPERLAGQDQIARFLWCVADRIVYVPEPLYYYRGDNASTTRSRNSDHILGVRKVAPMVVEKFKDSGLYAEHRDAVDCIAVWMLYLSPVKAVCLMYDRPDRTRLTRMRAEIREAYPDYRRNPYYGLMNGKERLLARLNDFSPLLLCAGATAVSRFAPVLLPRHRRRSARWAT